LRNYIIKRILLIIPTLVAVSLVVFVLSKYVPNDQVVALLNLKGIHTDLDEAKDKEYAKAYLELGLDKPNFYLSLSPNYYPRNLNSLAYGDAKELFRDLLKRSYDTQDIKAVITQLRENKTPISTFNFELKRNESQAISHLLGKKLKKHKYYYPKFSWYGLDNQYHHWIKSFFTSGFGISITDGKQSFSKVFNALKWTLSITIVDLMLSIFLAIFIGKTMIKFEHKKWSKYLNQVLYFIYAIPIFWFATIMVVYFTTDDYGSWTNIFPSVGINVFPGKSITEQIALNWTKLILPILCLTFHSLAYSTRFLKRSISDELNKDYVAMAFAKGLTRNEVIDRHVFRNALIAFITVFVGATVAAFSGSLVIEVIFNIPGIGRLLFNSISSGDWNVIFCIVMVLALITTVVYLLGDILYAFFNPKLRFNI